ncbi:MAG: right-handed parallel beta-helix repeat-containing protein [Anaerolineales bacterium]|nr:right-handed parallel beta-helix repeat-containing protein [Anaerolineales bacterium]
MFPTIFTKRSLIATSASVLVITFLFTGIALGQAGNDRPAPAAPAFETNVGTQSAIGGWENYSGDGENNETTGEALWAISVLQCTSDCYVDDATGDDANGGTSWADAKKTIQAAVNQVHVGGTVHVAVGTYYEKNIAINKSVNILGDPGDTNPGPGSNTPVIDGSSDPGDAFLIANEVSNVTIQGFEICNFSSNDTGIGNGISAWVGSTSNITIQDNYFHHLGYNGVLVGNDWSSNPSKWGDHTNWLIKGNIIDNVAYIGFELTNTSNSSIEDNVIHLNNPTIGAIFSSARRSETGLTIKNNLMDGTPSTVFPVIYMYAYDLDMPNPHLDGVLIEGNTIATIGTPFQIYIRNINTGTVTDVQVHNNSLSTLKNLTSASIDATNNWWGNTDPTTVAASISGTVDFTPLLNSGTDTDLGAPGFQPSLSSLTVHTLGTQTGTTGRIQEGIILVSGSTVYVAAGTYNESVTINVDNLSLIGDSSSRPNITGGVKFDTDLTGLTLENFYVTGNAVLGQNSLVRMYGAITNLTVDNCVFDGENVSGRLGFSGGQLEGDVTITNSEFKNILGWALFDSRSGSGGDGSAMDTVTFANNHIHDSNGSVVFRGFSTDRTNVANIYDNTWENIGGANGEQGQHWAALEVNRAIEANVYGNTVNNVSLGQWGEGQAFQFWNIDTLNVYENSITNNAQGIFIYGDDGGGLGGPFAVPGGTIYYNNIVGNTDFGLKLDPAATGGPLNGECNWWGDNSGPSGAGTGSGDFVSTNVDFDPWWWNGPYPNGHCGAPGSITVLKYNDLNRNGQRDDDELGLKDWEFTIGGDSQTTNENGEATFEGLIAGEEYEICETLEDGWANSTNLCQTVTATAGGGTPGPDPVILTTPAGNSYEIDFQGVSNGGLTWEYQVTTQPGSQDLSHWVLGLCMPESNVTGSTPPYNDFNTDPTTQVTGAKWESKGGIFSISFDTVYPIGTTEVGVKSGGGGGGGGGNQSNKVATGTIAGPECNGILVEPVKFGNYQVNPVIEIEKTVYAGHDSGEFCPGGELVVGENGDEVTYCFEVTNTGDTYLYVTQVEDGALDVTVPVGQLLAPDDSVIVYYEGTIDGDLINTASVSGNPTDDHGEDISGVDDVSDDDDAEVNEVELATLIMEKELIIDGIDTLTCADFSFKVNDGAAIPFEADCSNSLSVPAGTYTVVEVVDPGYDTTYDNCTDVVLANGGTATCTVTNELKPPETGSITIKKNVDDDAFSALDFDFLFNGYTPFSISEDDTAGYVQTDLPAGNYPVTETVPDGWDLTSISCGGLNNNTGLIDGLTIVLEAGEDAVCTFNNTKEPDLVSIWVEKYEDTDGDGDAPNLEDPKEPRATVPFDFVLYDENGEVAVDTTNGNGSISFGQFPADTYTVCEEDKAGWSNTFAGPGSIVADPEDEGRVCVSKTLEPGQGWTFVFANVRPVGIWVEKYEDTDGDGDAPNLEEPKEPRTTAPFGFVLYDENGEVDAKTTDGNGGISFGQFMPGTYTVCEEDKAGWTNTFAGPGDIVPDPEEEGRVCVSKTLKSGQGWTFVFANEQAPKTCIELVKTGPSEAEPGETITYHFEVRNCGDVILAGGAQVYDPLFSSSPIWDGDLEPGESHEFDKTYTLPGDQCGDFTNNAWAIGHPPGYPAVRDDASWTVDVSCGTGECQPGTFIFKGSDPLSGPAGNIKTFTVNGVNVKVTGWSRDKATGAYAPAYVGVYSGGLGVTDLVSDGNGSNYQHTVDNEGADNFLLFEFDQLVVPNQLYLGYVKTDTDATLWFGNVANGAGMSDALLGGLSTEENLGNGSVRWVDFNGGGQAGNLLVVAAKLGDSDDHFKVQKLAFTCPTSSITIIKEADPEDDTEVEFTSPELGTFTLKDPSDNTKTFSDLSPGAYSFAETVPDGWTLDSLGCVTNDISDPSPVLSMPQVEIQLDPGEEVTCTFTNKKNGEPPEWDKSSLIFTEGCDGDCDQITVTVCNGAGSEDMEGSTTWELYWIASGNPKDGTVIDNGTIDPLAAGECQVLTYNPADNPNGASGNYMFKAYQRPGHPGEGVLWSNACEELVCEDPTNDDGLADLNTTVPASIDCEVSEWSPWSECLLECGGGTQIRTRTVLVEPQNGGAACPVLEEMQPCNTDLCDLVD